MKETRVIIVFALLQLMSFSSCVYPYGLSVDEEALTPLLVVEGDIIANGITRIQLSRTVALKETVLSLECQALVYIEDEHGGRYVAKEIESGIYEAETQALNSHLRYRLYIELANKMSYVSEYVPVCISPPIDSVGYVVNATKTGVDFHVSTHDPLGKSRYYKWEYIEDWEINSEYYSELVFEAETGRYRSRSLEENLYYCWTKGESTVILLGQSTRLQEDVIANRKIATLWEYDQRVSVLYCMQVIQKVLTREGYTYWENLRKNTEDMGGIFSTQASEIKGNIISLSNPDEVVLGYISASTVSYSNRVFFPGGVLKRRTVVCGVDEIAPSDTQAGLSLASTGMLPIKYNAFGEVEWRPGSCSDCRRYGSKKKPSWWPSNHI